VAQELTALALSGYPDWVKHGLHREHEFNTSASPPTNMDAEAVPVRVEDLVRLEQRRDARAGARGAREELQERREVLGADALGGQCRVAQGVRVWRG